MEKNNVPFDIETHQFDIAVSFPGEHREYVKAVVEALAKRIDKEQIFYDDYYTAFLARTSLDILLQDIYRNRSKLLVVFLCEDYQKKDWCGLEARAIGDIIKQRHDDQIMPIRMDDGKVERFFSLDGYIDGRRHNASEVADLIYQRFTGKLNITDVSTAKTPSPALPLNNLVERNTSFSGRQDKLAEIHALLKEGGAVCVKQVIAGLGGVGKTQLVLEYAHRFGSEYKDAVWWINAERLPGSASISKKDLLEYAVKCEFIPGGMEAALKLKDEDFIRLWNDWFDSHDSFLLIFDNAEDATDIRPYTDRIKAGHVLITTRDTKLALPNAKPVDLDVITPKEARAFMRERLSDMAIGKTSTLDDLIERLGRLPLALEQAAAFIANKNYNCDCQLYLEELTKNGLELLGQATTQPLSYHAIVTTTWKISFAKLSESARQLLNLCAYFAPDRIPLDFFKQQSKNLSLPLGNQL